MYVLLALILLSILLITNKNVNLLSTFATVAIERNYTRIEVITFKKGCISEIQRCKYMSNLR